MAEQQPLLPGVDDATAHLALQTHRLDLEAHIHERAFVGEIDNDVTVALQPYRADLDHEVAELVIQEREGGEVAAAIEAGWIEVEAPVGAEATDEDQPPDEVEAAAEVEDATENAPATDHQGLPPIRAEYWRAVHDRVRRLRQECAVCKESFVQQDTIRAPCGDSYCRTCLVDLFTRSLTDRSLCPPHCCGEPIPAEEHRAFIGTELVNHFLEKKEEFETTNPTYCHQPQCAEFIPLLNANGQIINYIVERPELAQCKRCDSITCTICKKEKHDGECPEDPAIQELLRVAGERGWQRCPTCERMVEKRIGCNHISKSACVLRSRASVLYLPSSVACICTAQFCYVCAAPWRTCRCEWWDGEEQYRNELAAFMDRENANANAWGAPRVANAWLDWLDEPVVAAPVQQPVQQPVAGPDVAEEQRNQQDRQQGDDHDCTHERWKRVKGPKDCESCGQQMPTWLNKCRQCNITVCKRCKPDRRGPAVL